MMSLMSRGECEYNSYVSFVCLYFLVKLVFLGIDFFFEYMRFLEIVKSRKLLLPSFAALPLLMAYAGHTTIVIPKPLVSYVGLEVLDLGLLS